MGILNSEEYTSVNCHFVRLKRKPGNCVRITNNLFMILDIRLKPKTYNEIV